MGEKQYCGWRFVQSLMARLFLCIDDDFDTISLYAFGTVLVPNTVIIVVYDFTLMPKGELCIRRVL